MTDPTDPLAAARRVKELAAKCASKQIDDWRTLAPALADAVLAAPQYQEWPCGHASKIDPELGEWDGCPTCAMMGGVQERLRAKDAEIEQLADAHARTTREQADPNLALAVENERLNAQLDADINVGIRQCELLRDARAEVERLRAELAEARDRHEATNNDFQAAIDRLTERGAEVERLKAEAERVSEWSGKAELPKAVLRIEKEAARLESGVDEGAAAALSANAPGWIAFLVRNLRKAKTSLDEQTERMGLEIESSVFYREERDRLANELSAWKKVVVSMSEFVETPEELTAEIDNWREQIFGLSDKRDKLQAFKSWVHAYLDGKGVPHHPPGTHGASGCRIGDRMDYVFAEMERLKEAAKRPVSKEGRPMNRRKGRIVQASELLKEIQDIVSKFGDTCFYVTNLAWGSVALWQQSDYDQSVAALATAPTPGPTPIRPLGENDMKKLTAAAPAAETPRHTHSLERTSPMGGPFLGRCRYCGAEELRPRAALEACEAAPAQDEQLLDALTPPPGADTDSPAERR